MDGISPMVGAVSAVGVNRHEFVICCVWLVGVYICGLSWVGIYRYDMKLMLVSHPWFVGMCR